MPRRLRIDSRAEGIARIMTTPPNGWSNMTPGASRPTRGEAHRGEAAK
jgi:hypothetical protein